MTKVILDKDGLRVDGQPFTMIGGELHNSSSSTKRQISDNFARAAGLGVNTVLAPVCWDIVEPQEGVFDFSLVDDMLEAARREKVRLVLLWFGSWKNAVSSYAPSWVKIDTDRFTRARALTSGSLEHLSPFCLAARKADANAFSMFMRHLEATDTDGTVLMVQVENEVGILGDSRDRSELAEQAWLTDVPTEVLRAVSDAVGTPGHMAWLAAGSRTFGTWKDVFGESEDADEIFMAWGYSTYIQEVAKAGRQEFKVPLFVNAWLDSEYALDDDAMEPIPAMAGGLRPGAYPSGGPIARVGAVWRAMAPDIDVLAPDIYFGNFANICSKFLAISGHLLIPEMRRSRLGMAHMLYAVAECRAICVSPFGIDSVDPGSEEETILIDGIKLAKAAALAARDLAPNKSRGFIIDKDTPSWSVTFGGFKIEVSLRPGADFGYGAVIEEKPGTFLLLGRDYHVGFSGLGNARAGILDATQLDLADDWNVVQRMNGDETMAGSGIRMLPIRPEAGRVFPIPSLSRSTGIVRTRLYSF